jgi:DNA polymerase-3 subunit alpha
MKEFVHLHNHTHYSILDAIITTKELVEAAKNDNQKAVALTDHGVMFGTIEFYEECKKNDIKPIIGCEVYIANGSRLDKTAGKLKTKKRNYFHLLLLAKNEIGYRNLMKLSSLAHTEGYYYRPRIDKELLEKYSKGLVCTSACMGGIIPALLLERKIEEAEKEAEFYKNIFGDDFYIEIQNHKYETDEFLTKELTNLAKKMNIKIVATNDIHYLRKEDAIAHNAFLNIKDAKGKDEVNIEDLRYGTSEFYFKTQAEMNELFKDFPEAIENTIEIAEKCNLELELGKLYMPEFPIPETSKAENLDNYLRELVFEGLQKKYNIDEKEIDEKIKSRAEYELDIIQKMKFPGYFLIVWDFIRAAKELGVRVGPGRGSAAGSIVAYALDITNVDPLKYNLLFERFLNPERVSMPDIDIDFNDESRDKVIDYVKNKYGENSVAQIVTFGTLATRAVISDVGRVLGLELDKVKKITKEIETVQGKMEKIKDAKAKASLQWIKNEATPNFQKLFELCEVLENKNRNTGTHAAGVVIAPGEISDYVPLYKSDKSGKSQSLEIVTQYEMNHLEKAGLVKMDFLGLRTLSIIDRTLEMIKQNHQIEIDIDKIDFNDSATFKMLGNGETKAVFQFESKGMQEYLKQLKPKDLEELTAMNALYRPGPMDNIPSFINRKYKKEPIKYLHPIMEKALKNTYGIIVYQEQVMQLVQDLAGFSLGEADVMLRAMGKKKLEEMIKLKSKFSEGCKKNEIPEKLATEIFDLIVKFANYGFNKSHSLAYSYLAYQTAWLKTHYSAEFLAACMTAAMNEQNGLVELIEEANKLKIKVLPPDVNSSNTYFVAKNKQIIFGLAGIKGVGITAVDNIVEVRREKPFNSIFDFSLRFEQNNKRVLEALVCAGAFDSIYSENERASLNASVDVALEFAKKVTSRQENDTADLFAASSGEKEENIATPKLIFAPEWNDIERIAKEKEFLNFYLSGHPLDKCYSAVKSLNSISLSNDTEDIELGKAAKNISTYGIISGLITDIRTREDKEKRKIAFVKIQNYDGFAELIFWSDSCAKCFDKLKIDTTICCQGKIEKEAGEMTKIVVDDVFSIDEAIKKFTSSLNIFINLEDFDNSKLDLLNDFAKEKAANSRHNYGYKKCVFVVYNSQNDYQQKYSASNLGIEFNFETISFLANIFEKENVSLSIIMISAPAQEKRSWRK